MYMSQWVSLRIRAESLLPGQRVSVRGKSDRVVTVLRSPDGELHAIDAYCFHHGAHLGGGDLVRAPVCRGGGGGGGGGSSVADIEEACLLAALLAPQRRSKTGSEEKKAST